MNFILFDDASRGDLLPLTFTRPVADIRVGILTIREKWEKLLNTKTSTLTEKYLSAKFPLIKGEMNILINGSVLPTEDLVKAILALKPNQALVCKEYIIAQLLSEKDLEDVSPVDTTLDEAEKPDLDGSDVIEYELPHIKISHTWDIFSVNGKALTDDFELITKGRKSAKLDETNRLINPEQIFVEPGAKASCAIINATDGPVYIGKDAEILDGAIIKGPVALCEHATLKMAAKIYGPTTIGPHSKVGGELNSVVIFGYSNKAHDGFIGHAVIGEWCNIGADSNNSNLKNTYDEVKLWNYQQESFIQTGLQFCGIIMGDHTKCGINTMFNTGTVIGVSANIAGHGFQRNFIPSFSWGSSITGFTTFDLGKAIDIATRMYSRRNMEFTDIDKEIMKEVYSLTLSYRKRNRI